MTTQMGRYGPQANQGSSKNPKNFQEMARPRALFSGVFNMRLWNVSSYESSYLPCAHKNLFPSKEGTPPHGIRAILLMCDKEAIEVQKILPFLSDTWPLCRIGRAVIRASQSCRQSCNKSQCPACGCRSHHSCTHAPQFSRSFPAREWGSVLQRQGACGQCP